MKTNRSLDWLENEFPKDVADVREKLMRGANEYGDSSFDRSPLDIFDELDEEVLDIVGWSLILRQRLKALRKKLEEL